MSTFPAISPLWREQDFHTGQAATQLDLVWQQGQQHQLQGVNGIRLHYTSWQPPSARAALVIVPGRIEAGHKYVELVADAIAAGYQVFVLDHRGQGLSERESTDPQLGDVRQFADYVQDLADFFSQVRQHTQLPILAVAHSMGGGILCRYLQSNAKPVCAAAVFSSPMLGIVTRPVPSLLAGPLSRMMRWLNQQCSSRRWYVAGQGPYQDKAFAGNDLTHSEARYHWFRRLYQRYPQYQLGGVSWRWLEQALLACQQMRAAKVPNIPCLLIQAGADQVVDNQAQQQLWRQWCRQPDFAASSRSQNLATARHELLAETDDIRAQWFQTLAQFLAQLDRVTAT